MVADTQSLRPLGLGQLLDRAIRLYRRHFLTFTGIVALMLVPLMLIQLVGTLINVPNALAAQEAMQNFATSDDPFGTYMRSLSTMTGGALTTIVNLLYVILVNGLAMAALSYAVANGYLNAETDVFTAYGRSASIWLRVLGAMLLVFLLFILLIVLFFIPCVGQIFGFGILVYFYTVLNQLYIPILVIENKGPWQAIRRSWDLARRRFWWVLGFMVVLYILAQLAIVGPAALVSGLSTFILNSAMPNADLVTQQSILTVVQLIVSLFTSLLIIPLQVVATIVMYFDLRVRTEGFDITVMAAQSEAQTLPSAEQLMQQTPPPENSEIVTGNELLYFGGVGVGTFAIVGGLYVVLFGIIFSIMMAAS